MKLDDTRLSPPPQQVTLDVLLEKYAKGDEKSIEDVRRRVARALAAVEKDPAAWEPVFYEALVSGFIPGGRVNSAAGTRLQATLINCFVQPVGDSVSETVDGKPGIYVALQEAAETMRRGGGVGYDFSAIRPKGAWVRGTESTASGPVSYMRVFDKSCETVESAGSRRGAQMGILRCDHPDIEEFIHVKDHGDLKNFNVSVAVTDEFMRAVESSGEWELVHKQAPGADFEGERRQRDDGLWVYRKLAARDLWQQVMESTYDHAEPGVFFLDRANADNNLSYVELIEATNPCGEEILPSYGCCCLGSINLTLFIRDSFRPAARFDFESFGKVVRPAVRMLDNVLDATVWPLPRQDAEARAKRRVGLGFTGLGDALIMLGLRYDTEEARRMASRVAEAMRDAAYAASSELARERGPFPLFDAERYLAAPRFASRLPERLKDDIRRHGIRNSHVLSVAPTGTISLAFADNASNGIEPPYAWTYQRKKRLPDSSMKTYDVEDHAWRLYRHRGGDVEKLPPHFVTALDISALDHMRMVAAVAPYVDSAISKTVNVPEDYPYPDFKDLYLEAWHAGLKGITTYRPNSVLGSVLSMTPAPQAEQPNDLDTSADRRIRLEATPQPALSSLRWPGRPKLAAGNPSWTYMVESPFGQFAIFVGHVEQGDPHPFEVWVNGAEQPRGLGAVAKTLSMDMRAQDRAWLRMKLDMLARTAGDDAFDCPMPPDGAAQRVPSLVAAFARIVRYRVCELGALADEHGPSPVLDALFARKEPKTGADGTMSWTLDVHNPRAGDDFVLILKELMLPGGQRRPYSIWMAGEYPRALDGLCKLLSLDMRVIDPAWIAMKLRKLLSYAEPLGDFMARVPGSQRQQHFPSTMAYVARLVIHRYAMLGVLDERGYPLSEMGVLEIPEDDRIAAHTRPHRALIGKKCPECGNATVIHKDGCEFCTACGAIGACG
ncbi:MAG TPA: adenosylcobalamin-dependent ribonucleoside-diphosphate reductase [Burkholderiales bacterium]|nr:adenosylcobalamin-dependent ribonucleoside-diphosphate reductase [Burkholderiales bacterium]